MNKILILLFAAVILLSIGGFAMADDSIGVSLPNPLCPGGTGSANCVNDFPTLITRITEYVVAIIGGLALIIFIYAGFLFVTSAGSPEQVGKAKKALIYAIVGTAIALAGSGLIAVIQAVIGTP